MEQNSVRLFDTQMMILTWRQNHKIKAKDHEMQSYQTLIKIYHTLHNHLIARHTAFPFQSLASVPVSTLFYDPMNTLPFTNGK